MSLGRSGRVWSKLAHSTVTKALGMGFASKQDQELQEEVRERAGGEGSVPWAPSRECSRPMGYLEVSPPWHQKVLQ